MIIADNARMQHVPVHRLPRPVRPERGVVARPVFGATKGRAA